MTPLTRTLALACASVTAALTGCDRTASVPPPAHPDQQVPDEPPALIDPAEAALYIGHPGVSFIDARPARAYRQGHPPGAVHVDWTDFRDHSASLMTGKLDTDLSRLADVFASRGVASDHWMIVLGDPSTLWGEEARIAWTLKYIGAAKVSLVDGGWATWTAAGMPTQKGRVERPPAVFVPVLNDGILARRQDVEDFAAERGDDRWGTVLLDVREPGEYRGAPDAPTYGALRAGHIPTAVNVPWRTLLDDQGRLRPRDELGELLIEHGVRPDARVITYCTGGVRSAHTWFVLRTLGYPDVRNFAGSWWEWSIDRRLPIETGGERLRPWTPPWPPGSEPPGDDDDSAGPIHRAGPSGDANAADLLRALKSRLNGDEADDELETSSELVRSLKARIEADDEQSTGPLVQKLKARLEGEPSPAASEAPEPSPEAE